MNEKTSNHQYIIRSTERNAPLAYFVAIHGFDTPFFSTVAKARRFQSKAEAEAYATRELFTDTRAFYVERVPALNIPRTEPS